MRKIRLRLKLPLIKIAGLGPRRIRGAFRVFRRPLAALAYHLHLRGIGTPVCIGLRGGGEYRVGSGDDFGCLWSCWVDGEYPVSGAETLIFDAGANLGAFSLYAAHHCPAARVHALEPVAETFSRLWENIGASPHGGRVSARRAGIAGAAGTREIHVAANSPYSGFFSAAGALRSESVEVLHLAGWLAAAGDPPEADLLKMDCEGAEMEALLGAERGVLRRFRRILFEYHEASGIPYARVAEHLGRAGFVCRRLRREPGYGTGIAWYERQDPGSGG